MDTTLALMRVWSDRAFRRLCGPQPHPRHRLGPILEFETRSGLADFLTGRNHAKIDALDYMAVDTTAWWDERADIAL